MRIVPAALRLLALAALATVGRAGPLAALDARRPVAERIALIDRFVHEHYYDPAGLMNSHMRWDEERPFRADDFSPADSALAGPEPHQWMSYENSAFISGLFLAAQCFRYRATGDPEALACARRAFGSLDANYALSEHADPAAAGPSQRAGLAEAAPAAAPRGGFFCKPYYGMATDHTSTEQHFGALYGLYQYWPLAPTELRPRIRQIFSEVSRRWRGAYRINFFGETWNIEESQPRAQRHMPAWAVIHRMAHAVTGEPECLEEYRRLDALFGALPTPRETALGTGKPSYISTEDRSFHVQIVMGADVLADLEPGAGERWRRGMRAWWDYSLIGQREDLLSYYFIQVDALTGAWRKLPLSIKPRAQWRSPFMLHNATLPVCWLGTRERQAITSAILVHRLPDGAPDARGRLRQVLGGLTKEQLHWFADPEGVMPPELRWMLNVLQGDSLAFHSLGYWYARAHGVDPDAPEPASSKP